MATRYSVYASETDSTPDTYGDWVNAEEHEKEVQELEEKITELDDNLTDVKGELGIAEGERDTALSDLVQLKEEFEALKKHSNDVESVVHGLATKLADIVEQYADRAAYPTLDALKQQYGEYVPYSVWRGE